MTQTRLIKPWNGRRWKQKWLCKVEWWKLYQLEHDDGCFASVKAFMGGYKSREDKADGSWHSAPVKESKLRHTPSLACRLTILSCHICKTWTPCRSGNISKPSNRHVNVHWGLCYVTNSCGPLSQRPADVQYHDGTTTGSSCENEGDFDKFSSRNLLK